MDRLKLWLTVFRLRTLPLSVSGIIVGACIAYYNGYFNVLIFMLALLVTLALQILSNLANDYGDGVKGTDNEHRIGPERAVQSGKITPDEMFDAIKVNILVVIFLVLMLIMTAFGSAYFLYSMLFFILGGLSVYAALKYTIGESAYGYRALGDFIVFLFFGVLSVMGSYFMFAKSLEHVLILPACMVGLLSAGVLNLNNMRDLESDTKADKITVAVKFGLERAKKYHAFLILSALALGLVFGILYYRSFASFLFFLAYVPIVKHLKFVFKVQEPKDLDSQLKVLALSTFALSVLLGLGFIINGM
jgi:1,4-dihydroxy-2-naphthoate octaprenyltransferase